MSEENETKEVAGTETETRVDESAVDAFRAMGHKVLLPDTTVLVYNELKRKKDRMQPGNLTPEGFAFVSLLSDMIDGREPFSHDPTQVDQPPAASGE